MEIRVPTNQSSMFLKAPGIPFAYSGQEISIACVYAGAKSEDAGRRIGFEIGIELGQRA